MTDNIQALQDEINADSWPEGWAIFTSSGSANGPYQIQHFDEEEVGATQLENDEAAWRIVWTGTARHHRLARDFIQKHNQLEYDAIVKYMAKEIPC